MSAAHSIPITIADTLIDLASPLSADELGITQRLGPFFGRPDNPLAHVALRWQESIEPPIPSGDVIYDAGVVWRMHRATVPGVGEVYEAALHHQSDSRSALVKAVLRANPSWDDLTLTERRSGPSWGSLLAISAGELILRAAIVLTGGLMFHASGLDDNGQGVLFLGHSGAGKSTQAGLWRQEPGVLVMNEDRMAVRADEQGARCYGTPWGGTAGHVLNHAAPLAGIVVIEQGPENGIEPILPAAAASLLTARAYLPYWDPALMRRALGNVNAMLSKVPVYRLRCRPEPAVIPLVRSLYRTPAP